MVKIYYRDNKTKQLQELPEFKPGCWIHAQTPSEKEINYLEDKFHLEDGILRDAIDIHEVPRLEEEDGILYLFIRFPYKEGELTSTAPLLVAVGKNFIITVTPVDFPYMEKLFNLKNGHAVLTGQRAILVFQIASLINSSYNSFLMGINKQVRSISINFDKVSNKDIIQFVAFESILNDFLSALVPLNTVFHTLTSGRFLKLNEDEKDLIQDLSLGTGQLIEISKTNLRSIVNIREAYSTIMTNSLNRVIKLFTSVTVILAIPTMLASIYGMNVRLPFAGSPYAFLVIILTTIVISVVLVFIFFKNRWL